MRRVVVTGVGLVSSLGEGLPAHLAALRADPAPRLDRERFAPYPVHPAVPIEWDRQIPKKADQRQMDAWQKLGCYAAGLALDMADAKSDPDLKGRLQILVASGGGERDYAVDGQILTGLRSAAEPGVFLNERLMSDLRPTLFLAQLSNLLAGNIAIVHGITGPSRTFMGEEAAGTDALRIARERVAAAQADIVLVGGSYNAERPDSLLIFEMGGYLWTGPETPVAQRPAPGGFVLGSAACFLVVESEEHAARRGVTPLASLDAVATARTRREPGDVERSLERLWQEAAPSEEAALLSAATGVTAPTADEMAVLGRLAPGRPVLCLGDRLGHPLEAAAPVGAALAAGLIQEGDAHEIVLTVVGHHRGEGLVKVALPR